MANRRSSVRLSREEPATTRSNWMTIAYPLKPVSRAGNQQKPGFRASKAAKAARMYHSGRKHASRNRTDGTAYCQINVCRRRTSAPRGGYATASKSGGCGRNSSAASADRNQLNMSIGGGVPMIFLPTRPKGRRTLKTGRWPAILDAAPDLHVLQPSDF